MASPIESKPTLLCVFVHGFKGDDNTFGGFPAHLKALLQNALPTQDVRIAVYPRFDTRGELANVVASFRDWFVRPFLWSGPLAP